MIKCRLGCLFLIFPPLPLKHPESATGQPACGVRGKTRGLPKSVGFVLSLSVIVDEIFHSGWC